MFLKDYITAVANLSKLNENGNDENGNSIRPFLTRCVNQAYKEIAQNYDWEFLKRYGDMQTVANYTTGTATVTNGSNTVSGSGTSWTTAMQGRYFKPSTGYNWYKIAYVDATAQTLVLEQPMIEATGSGTYIIWKRFYYLKSEVDRILDFGTWIKNGELLDQTTRDIEDITASVANTGASDYFSTYGVNPIEFSYSDGSVTIGINTNVLTGSGTAWLANAEAGDIVTINGSVTAQDNTVLRVKRVESDTRIILTNYTKVDYPAATTYTIQKDNPIGVQFYSSADKQYIYPYTYFRRVWSMVNENLDTTEFPEKFDLAIIDGALARVFEYQNDVNKKVNKLQDFSARIKDLKRMGYTSKPRFRQMKPYIPARSGYGCRRVY